MPEAPEAEANRLRIERECLNRTIEAAEPGEDRFMPQSPKVATYDLAPEMAAAEVSDKLVEAIGAGYDLIVVNFANPDMVGHTGSLPAAMRATHWPAP